MAKARMDITRVWVCECGCDWVVVVVEEGAVDRPETEPCGATKRTC